VEGDLSCTSLSLSTLLSPTPPGHEHTWDALCRYVLVCMYTRICMPSVKISPLAGTLVCAHRRSVDEKYRRVLFSFPVREEPPPA